MPERRYVTYHVLAAAYKGGRAKLDALLTHTVDEGTDTVLCGGVKLDNLTQVDEGLAPPTCPKCLKRDPRFTERAK